MLWEMFKFHESSANDSPAAISSTDNTQPSLEETDKETNSDNVEQKLEEGDLFISTLWGIHSKLNELRGSMSQQNVEDQPKDEGTDSEDATLPPTQLVLQISSKIQEETLRWLIDKLKGRKRDGGGELVVMKQPVNTADNFILHLSASKLKLLEVAEEIELVKIDRFGKRREFTVAQLEDFVFDGMHVDDLLTDSEKQTIVRHELENIRALSEDTSLPGYSTHKFYEGQSIFQACQHWGIVTKVYPLHDREALKKLGRSWYMSLFAQQPLEEIRLYFGEAIALYFKFLDFYTRALIVPVVLGFLQLLVSRETVPFFCVFNVVWVTLCLELWKRKSNELAFMWNTIGMTSMDEPRPNFRGAMGIDAITGKVQPQSPRYMTYVKMYGVSLPLTVVCMVIAFYVMLLPFWAEDYIKQLDESHQQYIILPSLIYSLVVPIVNVYFRMFATFLTEWENHRTQSQFDRHRVTKLVLFEFVNNFLSLFYIGFILRDMEMLRSQLRNMLIMSQAICSFQEIVQPVAMNYYARKIQRSKLKLSPSTSQPKLFKNDKFVEEVNILTDIKIPTIQPEDSRIKQALKEGEMEIYEDPYDDYLELFIQFGYVFLFSSVYPIAAFWALLNNVLEIRADAFKLCKVFQRPMCRRVKDIGAWQRAFEVLGAISIFTNCGILYLSPGLREKTSNFSEVELLLTFVFLEHILLGIRYLLHIAISDKPEWIRVALARKNYESKQALKYEISQKNRRLLTRKFKTVHGPHSH